MNNKIESLLKVTPLSKDESQKLSGGFVCIKSSSWKFENISNNNCSGTASKRQNAQTLEPEIQNGNCGCRAC